ncbi:MAG: outer membrane beta-barrel protein [Leptolyngbya sp. BL-A-14]
MQPLLLAIIKLSSSTVPDLLIRHSFLPPGPHLSLHSTLWQQIAVWSSVLFSSFAWFTLPASALPDAEGYTRSISPQVSMTPMEAPAPRQPVLLEAAPQRNRYRAAALLPLQALEAMAATKQSDVSVTPATDPFTDSAIVDLLAQATNPPSSQQDNEPPQPTNGDPELGVLRLQVPRNAPSTLPVNNAGQNQTESAQPACASGVQPDPELGCLPLQPLLPPPPPRQPAVFFLVHLDYFRSSNVFSAVDPVDDGLVRPGLTLFAAPALGRNTYFVGSIDGNLVRYNTQSQIDYNELRFRAGIFQRLSPTMFGEIGWSNQQLFIAGSKLPGLPIGTRFLNDHAIRFELSRRDQLNKRLSLNTFYQLRLSFADPDIRSRVLNSFIASFSYDFQPNLQVGLDYQFALANFTAIRRDDQYHQLAARLTYTAFRNTQFNVFVGYSFGNSSDPTIDFSGLILGVSMTVNFGLF